MLYHTNIWSQKNPMVHQSDVSTDGYQDMILDIYSKTIREKICGKTTMVVLPPLKVNRYIPTILTLFLLFNKYLKEVHIIKMNS